MIPFAGILIVFAAVIGGFAMEGGPLKALAEPAEIVVIVGAALGAAMIGNPAAHLARAARAVLKIFHGPAYTTERYLSTLVMLAAVFQFARRNDVRKLEDAVEDPRASSVLSKYPSAHISADALEFVCDTLRLTTLGTISPYSVDEMLEKDLEVRRAAAAGSVQVLARLSDSLPGFGILAAVLGVILSMGFMKAAPLAIGVKIASALIGTFTGILLAYGVVTPVSERLATIEHAESAYFDALRAGLSSFARGMPVAIALECVRRAIPGDVRPDFALAEERCRAVNSAPLLAAKAHVAGRS